MELVEGERLTDLIPKNGLPAERILRVGESLADAVAAAHDRQITHQDLKPGNVMISAGGRVKVFDFGLAKLRPEPEAPASEESLTEEGRIVGTLSYMAPELYRLAGQLALARSDTDSAIHNLEQAQRLLAPRGVPWNPYRVPDHVPVWFALAEAYEADGQIERAIECYRRITTSDLEHIEYPIRFVRSFYRLGKLFQQIGEIEKARESHARFADYWRDGDLDRGAVEEAVRMAGR